MAKIGILWCTHFKRGPGRPRFWSLDLPDAYRPPSLFARVMQKAGHEVQLLVCDEELTVSDLDGTSARLHDDVQLLYVMTHGSFASGKYELYLHGLNWIVGDLGRSNLSVAVFDTCWLIDTNQSWESGWASAKIGAKLRLLLGIDGQVAIDRGTALRGKAFAEDLTLNNAAFADAWINAVRQNSLSPYAKKFAKAAAIGIGGDDNDAKQTLDTMSLANMYGPRLGQQIKFAIKF